MIATIQKIKRYSYRKVAYYSVYMEGRPYNEFEDFERRMDQVEAYRPQLEQIFQFIKEIGENYGAKKEHFRHERAAEALPPPYVYIEPGGLNKQFGLRVYCIRLSDEIVILLNGDMKTHQYPDQCENCRKHFKLADALSRKINQAIYDDYIELDGKDILVDDGFYLEI